MKILLTTEQYKPWTSVVLGPSKSFRHLAMTHDLYERMLSGEL